MFLVHSIRYINIRLSSVPSVSLPVLFYSILSARSYPAGNPQQGTLYRTLCGVLVTRSAKYKADVPDVAVASQAVYLHPSLKPCKAPPVPPNHGKPQNLLQKQDEGKKRTQIYFRGIVQVCINLTKTALGGNQFFLQRLRRITETSSMGALEFCLVPQQKKQGKGLFLVVLCVT
ncbi:hypothetical protein STEG23_011926, partial [Scotinomys teguina]